MIALDQVTFPPRTVPVAPREQAWYNIARKELWYAGGSTITVLICYNLDYSRGVRIKRDITTEGTEYTEYLDADTADSADSQSSSFHPWAFHLKVSLYLRVLRSSAS